MRDTAEPMSQANVDALQVWIDAFNRRDIDGLLELSDRDIEFRSILAPMMQGESVFRGPEGIHAYFESLDEAYDRVELVPSELIDAGAAVVVVEHVAWRGRESGAEGRTHLAPVVWLRAGKVFRVETFEDRAEALEAVGLTEQDARAASTAP
jgi:ketosteroid isomerase-like protein